MKTKNTPVTTDKKFDRLKKLHDLVMKYQIHECNSHCLTNNSIPNLQKQISHSHQLVKLALRDLREHRLQTKEEEIRCEKYIEKMRSNIEPLCVKLAGLRNTFESEKEGSDKSDGILCCSEGYPYPTSKYCYLDIKEDKWYYHRSEPRIVDDVVYDDRKVVEYNSTVLLMWEGYTCCRLVSEQFMLEYLVKYVSKCEPIFSLDVLEKLPPETVEYFKSEAGKHIHGRIMSVCELIGRLIGLKHIEQSIVCKFLTTELPSARIKSINVRACHQFIQEQKQNMIMQEKGQTTLRKFIRSKTRDELSMNDLFSADLIDKYVSRPSLVGPAETDIFEKIKFPDYFR